MKRIKPTLIFVALTILFLVASIANTSASPIDTVFFTVSMENPSTHYFHVELECTGLDLQEYQFKMPAWTPGYYWILDLAKNVTDFQVRDERGEALAWEKTKKDTWVVEAPNAKKLTVSYDVFAYQRSVAEPWLDDGRAFISPTGIFMYLNEKLDYPVNIKVNPFADWKNVSTGLKEVKNEPNTFIASNFDELYDCPILAGNMEVLSFQLNEVPYTIVMENPAEFDRKTYTSDFRKIAKSATELIGDVPYDKYTYLIMDQGFGGLEHRNSMAVFSNSNYDITNSEGYKGWLSFIAHEFFHLYNVKTIRPIELGPFDYSQENYTNMLWVAEGFTVYYEYLVLNRAGLFSRKEVLDALSHTFAKFENANGRKLLSARQASFDTWLNFFNWNNHTDNTTISYYDIGCALGMLLDLKIRNETNNEKSLDDVMRSIYYDFHKKQNRGYTDDEFRAVCEKIAGCSLEEIFNYAASTVPMDYQKYLSFAGIEINLNPEKEISFGVSLRKNGDNWIVSDIDRNSPAWQKGLSIDNQILSINGKAVNDESIKMLSNPKNTGKLSLKVSGRAGEKVIVIETFGKASCDYKMVPVAQMSTKQKTILESWIQE
ncbi:PDZ domain-containing protein [uncultured Draconibacterium sp.]|uniref:M61 family metallopeptidase n=1 Tax=uncultured Draconibacterium sp. TaxID=1573823 RepID=UPI0032179E92